MFGCFLEVVLYILCDLLRFDFDFLIFIRFVEDKDFRISFLYFLFIVFEGVLVLRIFLIIFIFKLLFRNCFVF